jgi:hypothetical protein
MTPTALAHPPITLPDLDAIRAAIDTTDERARLLRRLLRLALRLRPHLNTAAHPPAAVVTDTRGGPS